MKTSIELIIRGSINCILIDDDGIEYDVEILSFKNKSPWGIKNGRISKLYVHEKLTGKEIICYERDWCRRPKTENHRKILKYIISIYN